MESSFSLSLKCHIFINIAIIGQSVCTCAPQGAMYAHLYTACRSWTIFHSLVGNRIGFADTSEMFAVMSQSIMDDLCSYFRNGLAVQGGCLEALSVNITGNTTCPWMLCEPKYICGSGCAFFAHIVVSSCHLIFYAVVLSGQRTTFWVLNSSWKWPSDFFGILLISLMERKLHSSADTLTLCIPHI